MIRMQSTPVRYDNVQLLGGLDQVTPNLSLVPGVVRRALNFECSINGGYSRIAGYERFDGRARPSDATYTALGVNTPQNVTVGVTLTGSLSSSTGKVIVIDGSTVVVTKVTGSGFVVNDVLNNGSTNVATVSDLSAISLDGSTDARYKNLAADEYRTDIQAVPGSGDILGVGLLNGIVYAWRNNPGGSAANMYKSTASGWTQVTFGKEIYFNTGTAAVTIGQTITGATSSATGVIAKVIIESGTYGSSNAAGRFILSSDSGTFQAAENLQVGGVTKAVAVGGATAITLSPNGRYETVIANFGGATNSFRMYGCDSVNRAFEFDGTTFVPINTGMTSDTPKHIAAHKAHLFLSFGASLQFSGLGLPFQWTPVLGAGELAMNSEVTILIPLPGDQCSGALGIYTKRDTSVLYGTSSGNFALSTFNTGTGGYNYTAQNMDQAYVLDDRGIMSLGTTLNFGNFSPSSLTMNIRPFLEERSNLATASTVSREKGQYRVFFSDKKALYMTIMNGKLLGTMPIEFQHEVKNIVEGERVNGTTAIFFGSSEGFVYELDRGTSFDGQNIDANFALVYNYTKSPRIRKRYRKASIEMTGEGYAEIAFGYELGYRSDFITQPAPAPYTADLRKAYWDEFQWDNFVWDTNEVSPTEIEVVGTAENMGIFITSTSDQFPSFTINNIILHFNPRRGIR